MSGIAFEHQYTVEGYITFAIEVVSGKFSGASSFCISDKLLEDAVSHLTEMHNNLSGTYRINDYDSTDFILFESLMLGRLKISGQVGGDGNYSDQYLVYQFTTDQTALRSIILDFYRMLDGGILRIINKIIE